MARFKKFVNACTTFPLFSVSVAFAVDSDKLWLPHKYTTHFLQLKEAAEAAETLERCQTVLRGTIDLEQSKEGHLIFRILCRQSNNKTYNEMVDGLTMETLTTPFVVEEKMSGEELERLRLEEEMRRKEELELKKLNAWNQCSAQLQQKIGMMKGVKWVGDYPPEPQQFDETRATFIIDFDAQDMYGQALKYRARCHMILPDAIQLTIRKRSLFKDIPGHDGVE